MLAVVALCLGILNINAIDAQAATSITGNNTRSTAYNYGRWSSINSNYATIILESGQTESWLQFTLSPGEHIYLRASYQEEYAGEWFEVQNGVGITLGTPQMTPQNVYNADSITPDIYLDCDNYSTSTRNYYLVLHRGSVDINKSIYFSLSAYERIKTSSVNVSISGTASNKGNSSISMSGVDSSVISVNLTNDTKIPNKAIVTRISSSGTQSPSQGNVHHMVMPASNGNWYTSTVSSASSGHYNIDIDDGIPVKQKWSFKYNALATAKSTMRNVKLTIEFQYDLHDTDYETYIR
ncbi:MAG: hypothetical protein ACRC7V_00130 [Lachnospiraceae bacterium]